MPIGKKGVQEFEIIKSFYKGYQLDLSVGAMFILLPLLCIILWYIFEHRVFKSVALIFVVIFLILYISIGLADSGLYREWNAKINMQALQHFQNPSEVLKTLSAKLLALFFLLLALLFIPFYYLYKIKVQSVLNYSGDTSLKKRLVLGILFFMISTTVGVFTIRGGITNMPINQSVAYFSRSPFVNDIAVNPLYNLLQDWDIKSKLPGPDLYMMRSNEEALKLIMPDYHVNKDSFPSILKCVRPNIVYIYLESWSADNVGILGGVRDCTPQFDALCKDGILFSQAYSNAYVSDQGIVAGLSAFPAAHRMAIANQPTKIHNLPCITDHLIPLGYSTSFLFGGELVYGNLRGYLLEKQFAELREVYHLAKYPSGRLGVHDEYTFKELLLMLNQKKQPFLQGFFTTSTHMPYDHPKTDTWQSTKNDPEKAYTESMHYSDIHLGKFFVEAKKQAWYDSTLFIVVSDHSHNSIKQRDPMSSMQQHIPMLFVGGALKEEWRGIRSEKIVSQLDIVSTLLHQMHIDSKRFPWSRNMLNPETPSSAYYVFFGGAGYVNDSGFTASYYNNKNYICTNLVDTSKAAFFQSKAFSFQQLVFENVRLRK